MANRDAPVHRWVPWIAGYSKHFVEDAINRYTSGPSVVLDPFAGVGTTLLEADLAGHKAIGFETKRRLAGPDGPENRHAGIESAVRMLTVNAYYDFAAGSDAQNAPTRTLENAARFPRAPQGLSH